MATIFGDKVTANSVTFNDALSMPAGAISFGIDMIDDWDESPELDVETSPKGGGVDGEFLSGYFPQKSKHMIIGGWAYATSRLVAATIADIISRDAFPRNKDIVLTRYEPVPKQMTVRLEAKREIEWHRSTLGFRFLVPVIAGDPVKYATTVTNYGPIGVAGLSSGGRTYPRTYPLTYTTVSSGTENVMNVFNSGTADTWPIATIVGPVNSGGWRLSNETYGESLRFAVSLSATDTMVIDFGAGTALKNGASVTSLIIGDFWKIRPGNNVVKLYADYDPAASLTLQIRSAWE